MSRVIKLDIDVEQSVDILSSKSASGYLSLIIDGESVDFDYSADIELTYEPPEYSDGYLVYDERLCISYAAVTSMTYDDTITLSDNDSEQIHQIIIDSVMSVDDLDIKKMRSLA